MAAEGGQADSKDLQAQPNTNLADQKIASNHSNTAAAKHVRMGTVEIAQEEYQSNREDERTPA